MTQIDLNYTSLGTDARHQLEETLVQGQPAKFDISDLLAPSIAKLNIPRLLDEHGTAPAQPLDSKRHGTRGYIADICAPFLEHERMRGNNSDAGDHCLLASNRPQILWGLRPQSEPI